MLSSLPVSSIKKYLSGVLPLGWENYETETILLELSEPSELLSEKVNLVKVIQKNPKLFYEDPIFFLHACEVFNGQVTDFSSLPSINSLEAALAIVDMAKCQDISIEQSDPFSLGLKLTIKEILKDDGYSSLVWPFDSVGVTGLEPGATDQDMKNKAQAIKDYISGTYSKPTN